jgi:septum formation protein
MPGEGDVAMGARYLMARLVLASGSLSRLRLLRNAGIDPEVVVSGVDESVEGLGTSSAVVVLAERKALAVSKVRPHSLVLGCDSMLDLGGVSLGKPASPDEAIAMWKRLSGGRATLYTGHCLVDRAGNRISEVAATVVRFGTPNRDEVAAYVASGEPLAMAGAFSIDGLGAPFVEGIDGDASNVIGLSLPLLRKMLARMSVRLTDLWRGSGGPGA